jgi:4-amino-4-deoxy-L-arabinose transferase-like glycosyltransferase
MPVRHRWLLLAILLLAFALRLYRLGAESLWYDETVSVYLASQSLPDLIAHTAGDIHPPGYYLLLHGWTRLAGSSDWAVAFPSLFFGLVLVALAYWLGRRLFGPQVGLLAALLVALSPFNLWYSQEVRMYTLGAVLGLGLLGAVLSVCRPGIPTRRAGTESRPTRWRWLALYTLCGSLGLWVLYYFAFLLVAVNLMVGVWWLLNRRRVGWSWSFDWLRTWLGRWALAQGAVLLLYAPWLPTAWRQATQPPVPPWRSFTGLGDLLLQTGSALSLGQSVQPEKVWPLLVLFAALVVLGLLARPDRLSAGQPGRSDWLLAGYVVGPVLLIYLASFVTPLFHVRYVFTYSTPFYVLMAAGLAWLGRRWRLGLWLGLAVIVAASGVSIYAYHSDPRYATDDHRAAVRYLAEHWRPGDAILVNAGYTYTALLTYWSGDPIVWRGRLVGGKGIPPYELADEGPVVVQTGTVDGSAGLGWGDPASDFYAMSRAETGAALEQLFASSYRVWIYRIYDTVTDPDGFIRDWLDAHSTKFEDQVFTGESQLRVQGYRGQREPPADVRAAQAQGDYLDLGGGVLRFWGMAAPRSRVAVGGCLDLAPYWQRLGAVPEGLTLFAGLDGSSPDPVAQTDERPLGSLLAVDAWPAEVVIRTPLRICLPSGTPPGRYALVFGWYYFVNGQPVWLSPEDDYRLTWGDVEVVAPSDWAAMPLPEVAYPAGVTLGVVRFLGFDAPSLEARPGDPLRLDLYWQALGASPEPAAAVLQVVDRRGSVVAEVSGPPAEGRAPFAGLAAGQIVHDPRLVNLPSDLEPGVYALSLGRQRADGSWLPVRRSVFDLGVTYPLATIHVR